MKYPTETRLFQNHLQLKVPIFDLVKPIYEKTLLEHPTTPPPHWTKIWDASIALSEYLLDHFEHVKNKNVLEVGAGIGLPSFSIASNVKTITITDYSSEAIELVNENIRNLQLQNTFASLLDWQKPVEKIDCEVVLMSDINYDASEFTALVSFINSYLEKNCTIILSTPNRIISSPFIQQFNSFIKESHTVTIQNNHLTTEIGIFILQN
jgi:predicted nicotinamide N-methyase